MGGGSIFLCRGKNCIFLYRGSNFGFYYIRGQILAIFHIEGVKFWQFLTKYGHFLPNFGFFYIVGQILVIFVWGGQNGKICCIGGIENASFCIGGSRKCNFLYGDLKNAIFCIGGLENVILLYSPSRKQKISLHDMTSKLLLLNIYFIEYTLNIKYWQSYCYINILLVRCSNMKH